MARFEKLNKVGPDKYLNNEEIPRIITIFGSLKKNEASSDKSLPYHCQNKPLVCVHKITTKVSSIRKSQALLLKIFKL